MRSAVPVSSSVFLGRADTFFGVCEAIGQDLGLNANLLRVALGVGVLFQPAVVVGLYVLLGLIVLVSRLAYPAPKAVSADVVAIPSKPVAASTAEEAVVDEALALAA